MSLTKQVKTNLEHYNLWTDVEVICISGEVQQKSQDPESIEVLRGLAKSSNTKEWVVPQMVHPQHDITVKQMNSWFRGIEQVNGERPSQLLVALVNSDSTVVYYRIHDGIAKPVN